MNKKNKNIIICGGDGFCGWPLSLKLSDLGYQVIILDNFSRRKIDKELKTNSITKIYTIYERLKIWKKITKKKIKFHKIDISKNTKELKKLIIKYKPYAVYMFAELKSAPYSMMSLKHANLNFENNLVVNNNLLYLLTKYSSNTHYIHLGTMGVYGYDYSKKTLPEGYFKAKIFNDIGEAQNLKILHPASPGSIYHLTKALDELMFQFYNKMYGLKITDLHQGIVWGCNTKETNQHKKLTNRFDYDHIYGTVLNRFMAQAAVKFPLTIHGSGNQLRPFINIKDAVKSFVLALNFKKFNDVNIVNELGEIAKLNNIAKLINTKFGTEVKKITNPRKENENNFLKADPYKLKKLGIDFDKISFKNLEELFHLAHKFKHRINKSKIINKKKFWTLGKKN